MILEMMKILKYINNLPIWEKVFNGFMWATIFGLTLGKVAVFVVVLLLFLILNSKPGE